MEDFALLSLPFAHHAQFGDQETLGRRVLFSHISRNKL
jgi:hypothetical protein